MPAIITRGGMSAKAFGFAGGKVSVWNKISVGISGSWQNVGLSDNGSKMILVGSGPNYPLYSSDYGLTWNVGTIATSGYFYQVGISTNGNNAVIADSLPGYVYTTTNGGANWTTRTGSGTGQWYAIASDYAGTNLTIAAFGGIIRTSSNSGSTWTTRTTPTGNSLFVKACMGGTTGAKQYITRDTDYIISSTNTGSSWSNLTNAGQLSWNGISCSSDGSIIYALEFPGYIWKSSDSGSTWAATSLASDYYVGVSTDGSGSKVLAVNGSGQVFYSTNSGSTFSQMYFPYTLNSPRGPTISPDGTKAAIPDYGTSYIYIATLP